MKLGKLAPSFDPRGPHMAVSALRAAVPDIPKNVLWDEHVTNWPMANNDNWGCCTISSIVHATLLMTSVAQAPFLIPDAISLAVYKKLAGIDEGKSDDGLVERDVGRFWCDTGIDAGRQAPEVATTFLDLHPSRTDDICRSIALTGFAYLGWQLPQAALDSPRNWKASMVGGKPVGGHATIACGYRTQNDGTRIFKVPTWGAICDVEEAFLAGQLDEAHIVPSRQSWLNTEGLTPNSQTMTEILRISMGLAA